MGLLNIKRIAKHKAQRVSVSYAELEEYLKEWWSEKYNLPDNHPLLLQKTLEELIIEYWTDVFKKHPEELRKFENEINEKSKPHVSDEDEEWFKKVMKDDYNQDALKNDIKEKEEFSDTYNKDGLENNIRIGE